MPLQFLRIANCPTSRRLFVCSSRSATNSLSSGSIFRSISTTLSCRLLVRLVIVIRFLSGSGGGSGFVCLSRQEVINKSFAVLDVLGSCVLVANRQNMKHLAFFVWVHVKTN